MHQFPVEATTEKAHSRVATRQADLSQCAVGIMQKKALSQILLLHSITGGMQDAFRKLRCPCFRLISQVAVQSPALVAQLKILSPVTHIFTSAQMSITKTIKIKEMLLTIVSVFMTGGHKKQMRLLLSNYVHSTCATKVLCVDPFARCTCYILLLADDSCVPQIICIINFHCLLHFFTKDFITIFCYYLF
ncbi:uncharacterized protein LOC128326181 isoform X2 [Hemicordylus capensis]|uniref:uncharacterized protein LOC128326181 isoform X2 n=1 Tax=Hemicordylus capensis TaxID=884348 RepID=UPI002303E093|nr:uncharacterized protein LOC128326181 isoform X2 [Hemicordylus capensis]